MILGVDDIYTSYGLSQILFGVSLHVNGGECVSLLGRNGVGKSTTLRSIMGLTAPGRGTVTYNGQDITGRPAYRVAQLGIGFVPEDRRIFPALSVRENLEVARKTSASGRSREWTVQRVYDLFPVLAKLDDRKGGYLSGGEQQMLTIGRTLMGNPDLLLLDEPSEGLAPLVVRDLGAQIRRLKEEGITILLCEQNARFAIALSDRAYVLEKGHVRFSGTIAELQANTEIRRQYLGL
jgi:branched-chain amino acid transport system ATP-binding protein